MFRLLKTEGKARRGELETPHGTIQTPVFMNVGTQAAIKGGLDALDLREVPATALPVALFLFRHVLAHYVFQKFRRLLDGRLVKLALRFAVGVPKRLRPALFVLGELAPDDGLQFPGESRESSVTVQHEAPCETGKAPFALRLVDGAVHYVHLLLDEIARFADSPRLFPVAVHFGHVDETRLFVVVVLQGHAALRNGGNLYRRPVVRRFGRHPDKPLHFVLVGRHVLSGVDDALHRRAPVLWHFGKSARGPPRVHLMDSDGGKSIVRQLVQVA